MLGTAQVGKDRSPRPGVLWALSRNGLTHPVVGWDFSWLRGRLEESRLPWDYSEIVADLARRSPDLLDLGTGGGEWLASLEYRPARTVATEGWPPNLPAARDRLQPLGVAVVPDEGPDDNLTQSEPTADLPFPDASFHLICNRHEAFVARELARVLVPGGSFVTQQVGGWEQLPDLMGASKPSLPGLGWQLATAVAQLEAVGFAILARDEAHIRTAFSDVGALVWYLRAVPWAVPDFTVERYQARLRELHLLAAAGPIEFGEERFWLVARAPGTPAPAHRS